MLAPVILPRRAVSLTALIILAFTSPVLAMTYPDPEQVAADFPDRKTRAAAFVVLLTQVNHHGLSEAAAAQYRTALSQLDPPWVPEHRAFTEQYHAISDQPQFQYDITRKYLPELAPSLAGQLQEKEAQHKVDLLTEKLLKAGMLLVGLMIAVPLIFLVWCWKGKRKGPLIPDSFTGPWRLPDDLRRIKVFRKHYSVLFDCGQIYDKTIKEESYTTTTTTPGRQYTIGDTTYVEPGTTQTHYRVIKYDHYTFTTPDGRSTWAQFNQNSFHAVKGHIISTLSHDTAVLLAYNHTTNEFLRLRYNYIHAHRYPGRWVWVATLVVIALTLYPLAGYLAPGFQADTASIWTFIFWGVLAFAVISPIYIFAVKWLVQLVRNLEFRWRYEPKLRKFFEQCTLALLQRFPPLPKTPDIRPA